jgi:hypothetical protein
MFEKFPQWHVQPKNENARAHAPRLKVVAQPQGHRRFVSGEDDAIVLLSPD